MKTYKDFQNLASSEKITLAIVNGSRRLSGFVLIGANYRLSNFDVSVIKSITIDGIELSPANSFADLTENSYFNDRLQNFLFLRLPAGVSPNRSFITLTQKYFFSNKGVSLPWDLSEGFEVYFEPMVKSTSYFGVELDVQNEDTSAIEGSGSISYFNDQDFWPKNFDRIFFDNQIAEIYSWSSELPLSQAKLLFRGYVDSKSYGPSEVKQTIKDLLYNLRSTFAIKNVSNLGLRNDPNLDSAKQRVIYGRLKGFRPVNVDRPLNKSYPIAGELTFFFNSATVVGTGTKFKSQLVPKDKIPVNGIEYTVSKVMSDISLELTQPFGGVTLTQACEVIPSVNKNFINRTWLLSGHSLSQPSFKIQQGSTTQRLVLDSTKDIFEGDDLWIGVYPAGELVRVGKVVNDFIVNLSASTEIVYPVETPVHRPCVQNVRMNDLELQYKSDYEVDPISGQLLISELAEQNRAGLLETPDRVTVTTGTDFLQGAGTRFSSYLKPGNKVRPQGTTEFYQVLSVDDEKITLTEPYAGPSILGGVSLPNVIAVAGLANYKEKYQFRAVPASIDMHGKFFKIWDALGSVAIWFDIGNVGIEEPEHGCDRAIEITTITTKDSQYVVLQKVKQKLDLDPEAQFTCSILGDVLTIENREIGVRPPQRDTFAIDFEVQALNRHKQRIFAAPDVADSLDGQFFVIFDGHGSVAVWFDTDDSGTVEPNHQCDRAIEISTVMTDDDASTVRDKIKSALELDGAWLCSNVGTTGLEIDGVMVSASIGTMPSGFQIVRSSDGKSVYDLHGKYFILPYRVGGLSKTSGFYFDIGNQGISAPAISADDVHGVTSIDQDFNVEEVFQELAIAIEGDASKWTVAHSEGGLLITSVIHAAVTTDVHVGTSGLIIEVTQDGVAVSPVAGRILQYKNFVFGDSDVLSCDIYGKTDDGTITGNLLRTAPEIVEDILKAAGSADFIDSDNFQVAKKFFTEELAFAIPTGYQEKASNLTYREVINQINGSVLGVLIQSNDFKLQYSKLRPNSKLVQRIDETDIIDFDVDSTNANMIRTAVVEFDSREFDYLAQENSIKSVSADSEIANFILGTSKTKTFKTLCQTEGDAKRLADRWRFILEYSSNKFTFKTKLQAAHLQINDVILVSHPKLYRRMGGSAKAKIMMIEAIAKKGDGVEIVAIDLSNAFNRVAKYTTTKQKWETASDETRLLGGFYKDVEGLINGDPESFDTNLYW